MKKNSLSPNFSTGFALLEALFALFLTGFALKFFGFYGSIPKLSQTHFILTYPQNEGLVIRKEILQSSGLIFKVNHKQFQQGSHLYQSFEVE